MKMMNYAMMRCVSAIVVGVLLMVWPEAAILYLVIVVGLVFFLPSLFSLIGYYRKGRQLGMYFPIVSLGGLLFGLWLMVSPAFFVGILMYVLGLFWSLLESLKSSIFWAPVAMRRFPMAFT